jgi:long-chain acyl-CoA synthetase
MIVSSSPRKTTVIFNILILENKNFLGTRELQDETAGEYTWLTFGQVATRVENLASGLEQMKVPEMSCVGLYSVNRLEWTLGEYACYCLKYNCPVIVSLVTVPLYDTLGEKSIEYICNQTEMKYLFASKDKVRSLLIYQDFEYVKVCSCDSLHKIHNIHGSH